MRGATLTPSPNTSSPRKTISPLNSDVKCEIGIAHQLLLNGKRAVHCVEGASSPVVSLRAVAAVEPTMSVNMIAARRRSADSANGWLPCSPSLSWGPGRSSRTALGNRADLPPFPEWANRATRARRNMGDTLPIASPSMLLSDLF